MLKIKDNVDLNEIKEYIESNYEIPVKITLNCLKERELLMKDKKYDVTIRISKPDKRHYLYGKCDLVLWCDYKANKKWQCELSYHAGGYSCEYTKSNIDDFLGKWFKKSKEKQLTIFDI